MPQCESYIRASKGGLKQQYVCTYYNTPFLTLLLLWSAAATRCKRDRLLLSSYLHIPPPTDLGQFAVDTGSSVAGGNTYRCCQTCGRRSAASCCIYHFKSVAISISTQRLESVLSLTKICTRCVDENATEREENSTAPF